MNIEFIKQNRKYLPKVIVLLVIVLILATAGRVLAYMAAAYRIPAQIQGAIENCNYDDEMVNKSLAKHKETAGNLKKKSLFVAPRNVVAKMPVCTAILGDKALINGKYYGVGDTTAGAELLAVNAFDITIKWEEKEVKLVPFSVSNLTPEQMKGPSPKQGGGGGDGQPGEQPKVVQQEVRAMPGMRGGGPGRGSDRGGDRGSRGGFSGDERRQMMERYQNMSEDERRKFRDEQMRRFRSR